MSKKRIREIVRGRSVTVCSNWAQDGQRIDRLQEYVEAAIGLAVDSALTEAINLLRDEVRLWKESENDDEQELAIEVLRVAAGRIRAMKASDA